MQENNKNQGFWKGFLAGFGIFMVCALLIGVLKTNAFTTLIPLLFPRIAIAFRPLIDRKVRPAEGAETEGSDLLD